MSKSIGYFWPDENDTMEQNTFVVFRKSDMRSVLTEEEIGKIKDCSTKVEQWRLHHHTQGVEGFGKHVVIEESWPEYKGVVHKMLDRFSSSDVKHSHYHKDVSHLNRIDVYRVLERFGVTNQAIGHAIKKLLVAGGRGAGKSLVQDFKEAVDSINRAIQIIDEDKEII